MTQSVWAEVVCRAIAAIDPRQPSIVVSMGESPSSIPTRDRLEPSVLDDFSFPTVVVTEQTELPLAVKNLMISGPVLIEVGFQRGPNGGPEARIREVSRVQKLVAGIQAAESGVLAVLMPGSLTTSNLMRQVRESLVGALELKHVIFGRGVLEGAHSQFEVACLILSCQRDALGEACFYRVPRDGNQRQEVVQDHYALLSRVQRRGKFGYWASVEASNCETLAFDFRNPDLSERRHELRKLGHSKRLDAMFDVMRPSPSPGRLNPSRSQSVSADGEAPIFSERYCEPGTQGAVREIAARDISSEGVRAAGDESRYRMRHARDISLIPGDLVVRGLLPPAAVSGTELTVARFGQSLDDPVAGPGTIVLRPKKDTSHREVLSSLLFLTSEVALRLVTARDGRFQISPQALGQLEVPMPDDSTADAMSNIVGIRDSLREWLAEADEVLKTLYVSADAVAAKQDVLEVSRTLRARVEQGQAMDDPAERYRTTYPYPVAMRWRQVEAAYSSSDPDKALREILIAAEVTLAYAACVALLFSRSNRIELPCLKGVREKLASGRSGMGFGDWVNILNEATTSRAAKNLPADASLSEVRQFFTARELGQARARLKQLRDGEAHGRRPTGRELDDLVHQSHEDLVTILEAAAPLSDLGLIYVDQARVDSLSGNTSITFREFRGDHPVVPHRQMIMAGTQFEEGSLYLRDTDNQLHLLRPYLLADQCPSCTAWSMFTIDRLVKSVPDYKSLDHGHTEERLDCLDALIHVGLVGPQAQGA